MPLASPSTTHHLAESPSNRTGLAIAALIFGVLAVGLALTAATGGMFLPYAWYVVVALAVVTLCCGLLSVGRRHHRSTAGGVVAWIGSTLSQSPKTRMRTLPDTTSGMTVAVSPTTVTAARVSWGWSDRRERVHARRRRGAPA